MVGMCSDYVGGLGTETMLGGAVIGTMGGGVRGTLTVGKG